MRNAGRVRSDAIRQSAKGRDCTLRIPFACNHDAATVVLAHLPGSRGMGLKASDIHGAYACHACHDVIDGRRNPPKGVTGAMVLDAMLRGLAETQEQMVAEGLITVAGHEL